MNVHYFHNNRIFLFGNSGFSFTITKLNMMLQQLHNSGPKSNTAE